jgi:fatty-acyl-CoA synthase
MKEIPDLIAKRATLTPDKTAMVDLLSGASITYRTLNASATGAAMMLAGLGVAAQDRVAILCRNRIEFFELLFACAKLGALLVPLNWRMPDKELKTIIDDCGPKLVLTGAEDRDKLTDVAADATIIELDNPDANGYRARCAAAGHMPLREFWPGDEPWYLLYTSGTTGKPKAVIQTYQMAVVNYINIRQAIDLRAEDVTLNFLPLFHTAGINLYALPFLFAGAEVKILPSFDVEKTIALLEAGAVNAFFGVPAVYQEISLHPKFADADLSKIRSWGCGGAPLMDILVEKFAKRGALVCNGYGMTETGPTAFLMDEAHVKQKIGSAGQPQMMTAARIVTSNGYEAEPGKTGEIQLKGPGITPGYWNAPETTKAAFTDDGWLRTGDLAKTDADGFTYIVGRSKDMFISGGENIYPAEVENIYAKHPAVLEAAIIGIADEKWGEAGQAYILLREGETTNAEELTRYGRDHLAAYKVPKSFVFVDDFPRTAAGKVQKHLLAAKSTCS